MSAMAARARPQRRPVVEPARRVAFRLVERLPRHRRFRLSVVAAGMVIASLLTVVAGHSLVAEGQVRLGGVQSALQAEQVRHHQEVMAVASLENPSRIVADAHQNLHMVSAGQVQQLPYVPLGTPLSAPHVAP
ncbi:MAG: hypothetical protein ACRDYZ_09020 [Acidimicrobiales bacterium]